MIDPCHALGSDIRLKFALLLEPSFRPEFQRYKVLGPLPDPMRNIRPRHDKVRAIFTPPPDDQMRMRPARIMVDCADPFEPRPQIGFHLRDEITDEGLEVCHFGAVFGRNNEPEMMPVFGNGFDEIGRVGILAHGVKQFPAILLFQRCVAPDVSDVGCQCRHARCRHAHNACLDDDAPLPTACTDTGPGGKGSAANAADGRQRLRHPRQIGLRAPP